MKVSELMKQLQRENQEADVFIHYTPTGEWDDAVAPQIQSIFSNKIDTHVFISNMEEHVFTSNMEEKQTAL